ncbi:MAG: hypothetical protein LPK00_06160 [Bacillaceae bacterium]|nr:hypothetical protein [Bacillaceae bacterium]
MDHLYMFTSLHNLVTIAKLKNSIDIPETEGQPDWLLTLRKKLIIKVKELEELFRKE